MTMYSELMENRLKANREKVEFLQKAEYILGVVDNMRIKLEEIGAKADPSTWQDSINVTGRKKSDKKVSMKEIKVVLDEFLFSDDRLEIDSTHSGDWMFVIVRDKNTGGRYNVDIGMAGFECKKVEVSRKTRVVEDVEYKYECE